ncbi:type IV pilin protein [Acidovorax soli]|uniref:type IV pilin protein n=1 Tax=Acidovorax soli TaxID=592050 RepID=UPI0032B1F11A
MPVLRPSLPAPPIQGARAALGFTLVEIMLALVVVGVLAAVALPAYQQAVQKGRRSDAIAMLTAVQQAQERWRANRTGYTANLSDLGFSSGQSPKGYYEIALSNVDISTYTVTATPVSSGAQAKDSLCAKLGIAVSGGQVSYTSADSASQATSSKCWAQ